MELLVSGQIVKITPGQFISGREKANKDLGWKGIKFDRKMQFLEKHGFLNRQVNRHFTLNTIINWDIYQGSNFEGEQVSEQELNNTRTAGEQRVNTYKNVKNDKNVKKKTLSDDEFLSSLKEKFTWIDFDTVMIKMDAWLLVHPDRKKTRRFIVGWLNKMDRPVEMAEKPPTDEIKRRIWESKKAMKEYEEEKDGYIEPT